MSDDRDDGADGQDLAETFDETNLTRDGDDIAHLDIAPDVLDVTREEGDAEEDEAVGDDDDFDPDAASEDEIDALLERDDGIDYDVAAGPDITDRVSTEDGSAADFESETLSDGDLEDLGYDDEREPAEHDPHVEEQLDSGLDETFPASDPVSINPGAD
ncbi:MAG: primosomal protein [Caulobacteraceae bacterium]|nr:primosomal protein [Caulobacteraceae bacterium]